MESHDFFLVFFFCVCVFFFLGGGRRGLLVSPLIADGSVGAVGLLSLWGRH